MALDPAQNARRGYLREMGFVVGKNSWWMARCSQHGEQMHLSYLGGRCCKCQVESLVAQGLVKP